MAYKRKTWLNNIWEGILVIVVGMIVGTAGLGILNGMEESGTSGALIYNGVPLPLQILPLILMLGYLASLWGLVIILITLFRRVVKNRKSYDYGLLSFK